MNKKLITFLDKIFNDLDIYFYTIDNFFNKIVIFSGSYILEVSLIDKGGFVKKSNNFFFFLRKFGDINEVYKFVDEETYKKENKSISLIINLLIKYDYILKTLIIDENKLFYESIFEKINTSKKVLFILKGGGMEETIEKSFIGFCSYSNIELTVLYRFGEGYWGQQLNQDGFFNELKANNKDVSFIYKEDFDDNYIDSLINDKTEVFSFQYDYKGKNKNLNMLVLSSVTDAEIDCMRYKNIFSCYYSKTIGYSTDKFINTEKTEIFKRFNPQNIELLDSYSIVNNIDFILSGGMSWARDFSILNFLNGKYKGILISDEVHDIKNFKSMYRGIQSYYGFLGTFKLSNYGVFCHLDEFNDDDRSKMIATSICAGKPVIIPYNDGNIVKTVLDNNLGVAYKNGNKKDFIEKIKFFSENKLNLNKYSQNCKKYSKNNMSINSYINFIFNKTFN